MPRLELRAGIARVEECSRRQRRRKQIESHVVQMHVIIGTLHLAQVLRNIDIVRMCCVMCCLVLLTGHVLTHQGGGRKIVPYLEWR